MLPEEDRDVKLKLLEKENKLFKRKLERSEQEREALEIRLESMRKLLQTVAQERLTEETQKQLTMFRKFVPQEFLQHLNKENWLDVKLGDHLEHELTVLFSDIRSFTSLSEKMSIEENFDFVNSYLQYVYPPIHSQGGFVDKFIGDGIIALFYHSNNGIEAGINMHKALLKYNEEREKKNILPINIGIGLHSGKLMLGIIGVENRMQGTVISDTVNLASRLESLTKHYGSALIVSEKVLLESEKVYPNRFLGEVQVVGKTQKIKICEILSGEKESVFQKKCESKPFFETGLEMYFNKQFAEACVQFTHSLKTFADDKAAQYYLKKSANYMLSGVPEDWDGSDILLEK